MCFLVYTKRVSEAYKDSPSLTNGFQRSLKTARCRNSAETYNNFRVSYPSSESPRLAFDPAFGGWVNIFFSFAYERGACTLQVRERVLRRGHDVPEAVVRRRFDRSMQNFLGYYRRLANDWILFDNSGTSPQTVALAKGEHVRIINKKVHSALVKRYGQI